MLEDIKRIILKHRNALDILEDAGAKLQQITLICQKALKSGNKIIFFGNGGSAADSQHLAAEFVGRFQKNRKPLAALALSVNSSALTAIGNDFGFQEVFSRQISALAKPGDIAFGISTSGNSPNVLYGFKAAKERNAGTVAFLGKDGGKIASQVDIPLVISVEQTPRIQEIHILAGHIICELIEASL
ncbi:MAG: D-sedoheptulose 7-phosphate isomerase [Candidatus Omnitrophica bacterium]|nr:D-sedoheptulose 7-phosphate isomerase [Candidatus Omnitrophota bacterium]MCF7877217.1 D-sedoheptulose 7-phosphate isomerase [Candidatus Omnitrophota bacterium]MCF7878076.1 D-sedoheptulose 7-phosphate isomerase [Candidatus Omnitrophota bacterium]MCF7892757.1 D-sedoheptulose 7-phosphate isomerase [Candidatus Omnitrophota bacterium]